MAKKSFKSKILASVIAVLTVLAVVAIISLAALYSTQLATLDPTRRPTIPPTTTELPPVMRLPKTLVPHSYRVFLQPHLYTRIIEVENVTSPNQTRLFTGNSTVNFHCVQQTSTIYLHSKDLTIIGDAVVTDTKDNMGVKALQIIPHNDQSNFLEIVLEERLAAGKNYTLFLAFEGEMSYVLDGMFMSTYEEDQPDYEGDENTKRYLAATQMEPTHARKVFPCFDEPEMKAVFTVTIIHRRHTIAVGNGKKSGSSIVDDEWEATTFYPTPKMSTYLFAFTVSEFTATTSRHGHVEINTYARPEATAAGHAQYAADITARVLGFYVEYFGINYQQNTLDQFAMPDLGVSAMENWGLITYQERSLLYEEGVSSVLDKQIITVLVAHELAHQWFGNLVTMKWWNQIWLNEGFATYMSYLAVDRVEPSFKLKDTFFMNDLQSAFEVDALESTHPLNPPEEDVQSLRQIDSMFDTITYNKGGLLLRMLADTVGEEVFHKGIKSYLLDLSYKSAEQKDLWKHMQKAVDEDAIPVDVAAMMETWTNQIGYPVITINTANGKISQKHFLYNDSSESSLWWHIRVRFMTQTSQPEPISVTTSNPEHIGALISKDGEWILANVNRTGYYRVNYDQENWARLLTQLETDRHRIPMMNRIQLLDDAFNLARAKLANVTLSLNATRYLRNETEYIPWLLAVRNLEYFHSMFDRTEVNGPMQAYLRNLVEGLYDYFSNYTDNSEVPEDHILQQSQQIAISVACRNGLPQCLEMASNMFADWMKTDNNSIHSNLRSQVYCHAMAVGGEREWEFAWDKFQNTNDTSEREQLRSALSCTTKIWLLNRYLEYTLDPEKIRLMDVASTIGLVARNVAGHALAWNFIRANWEYVKEGDVPIMIDAVANRFSKEFELEELKRFAADNDLSDSQDIIQAIEQTRVNIKWVNEHKEVLLEWFKRETDS